MTSLILENGALRCELRPDLGGCIAGLWCGPQQVLQSTPAAKLESVRVSGSYPLLPYSNRVGHGRLHWAGRDYGLTPNFAPEPHAIHGVGWERAWVVEAATATQAVLAYRHAADAAWPFAFDSRQTLTLTQQALELQMSITNCATEAAPVGLGWHPYFAKSAHTRIAFAATGRWEMDPDKLPSVRLANPGLDTDCSTLEVDHCFDGWSGSVVLSEGPLRLQITSDLGCLVVFTMPQRDSIAIEPVSHVNNALSLAHDSGHNPQALGLRVLQPGATFSATMRIQVEQLA